MKCPHIWRKYAEVYPNYVKTDRRWYEFWRSEYVQDGRTISRYKECVICKKRKFLGDEKE